MLQFEPLWIIDVSSSYRHYVEMASEMPANEKIPFWKALRMQGIECALWPVLYSRIVSGVERRKSTKKSFMVKCMSGIVDYCSDFTLLQFNYDLWMYGTISGK